MAAVAGLWCVAALFATAVIALAVGRRPAGGLLVYGACFGISVAAFSLAFLHLDAAAAPAAVTLPLGLPTIGARFRVDALAAFFLAVVNLGGAVSWRP